MAIRAQQQYPRNVGSSHDGHVLKYVVFILKTEHVLLGAAFRVPLTWADMYKGRLGILKIIIYFILIKFDPCLLF